MKAYFIPHNKNIKIKQIASSTDFDIEFELSKSGDSDCFLATAIGNYIWVLESRNSPFDLQQHNNHFLPMFRGDIHFILDD